MLDSFNLIAAPLITAITPEQLRQLEEETAKKEFAPQHSLLSYWRLDARQTDKPLEEIEAALWQIPEADLVYREKTVTGATVMPDNDTYASQQNFLDPAPVGVDARFVWTKDGDGKGMYFIDLEEGWILDHEDLPNPQLINSNNNHPEVLRRYHGTAVVGVVAGVDNKKGIIGIAPNVANVRLVSHWCRE